MLSQLFGHQYFPNQNTAYNLDGKWGTVHSHHSHRAIIKIMPKKFTDEEYHKMLPKKQVGTAVIFFNTKGELLIVKPDYKDVWLIPGGSTDDDEAPLHCAIRETREEVGLTIEDLQLVGVYYAHRKGMHSDSLKFIFYGGVLTEGQISQIKLQTEELEKYAFASPGEAIPLLSSSLQKSIPMCLEAIKNKKVVYIETKNQ